jgi:ATP-binding cassette subfamily F protein uup
LDIQTLGVLEEFLDYFQGCLIVVSHDRYFLDRTVDFLVSVENGKLSGRYPTPYSTYLRLRTEEQQASAPAPAPTKPSAAPAAPKATSTNRKLSWKEQRELESLEARIAELESAKTTLTDAINAGGSDYQRLQAMGAELAALDGELESILMRWYELAELAA